MKLVGVLPRTRRRSPELNVIVGHRDRSLSRHGRRASRSSTPEPLRSASAARRPRTAMARASEGPSIGARSRAGGFVAPGRKREVASRTSIRPSAACRGASRKPGSGRSTAPDGAECQNHPPPPSSAPLFSAHSRHGGRLAGDSGSSGASSSSLTRGLSLPGTGAGEGNRTLVFSLGS